MKNKIITFHCCFLNLKLQNLYVHEVCLFADISIAYTAHSSKHTKPNLPNEKCGIQLFHVITLKSAFLLGLQRHVKCFFLLPKMFFIKCILLCSVELSCENLFFEKPEAVIRKKWRFNNLTKIFAEAIENKKVSFFGSTKDGTLFNLMTHWVFIGSKIKSREKDENVWSQIDRKF